MRARPRTMPLRIDPPEARLLLQLLGAARSTFAVIAPVDRLAERIAATLPHDERADALERYRNT